jgi:regulator of sigma D
MEEDELNQLSNEKFFDIFLGATKSMYKDYCHFMAIQEELKNCFVPDYEMALNNFEKKLSDIDNNDFFKVFLTKTKKMHIDYCEFKRAEEGLTSF